MLRHYSLLYICFFLVLLVGLLHLGGIFLYMYWSYWWYDWMMHFLAGVAGGFGAYWFIYDSGLWRRRSDKILVPVVSVALCLLIVGALWEIFEYSNGITDSHEGYRLDVIHDLIADTTGAIVAAIYSFKYTFTSRETTELPQ